MNAVWHKIAPYLTGGKSAIGAVLANHPYPARDLLITLAVLIFVAWALLRIAKAIPK
jgi:hypothetical protein